MDGRKNLRILVLSWRDPKHPLAGGAEQVMHEHMKGWIKSGHQVTLFSSKMKQLHKYEKIDGVKIIRKGHQYLGVQIAAFFYYLKNHRKYDFLIDQFHGIPFFTPLYSNKPKMAVIQEAARKVWLLNPLPRPWNRIVGTIGFLGEPFVFLLYKNIPFMTGSNSTKDDLIKIGIPKDHIHIVNHGTLILKPGKNIEKESIPTVIYLGRLSKDKGIEDALKTFLILKRKAGIKKGLRNKKINFWVVGKPETEEYGRYIKELTITLGLAKDVVFWNERLGYVKDKDKFKLLKRAWVMVNPSALEGWGLVNIEANSMGTPVVAYRSQGLIDSVREGISGQFAKSKDPSGLAEQLWEILSDRRKLKLMQKQSKDWSRQFTWQKSRVKSQKLIKSIFQLTLS